MHNPCFLSLLPWATTFSRYYSFVNFYFLRFFELEMFQAVPKVRSRTVVDMLDPWFSKCGRLISRVSYLLEMKILGLTPKLLCQKWWVFGSAACILTGFPDGSEAHQKSENHCVRCTAQSPVGLGPSNRRDKSQGMRLPYPPLQGLWFLCEMGSYWKIWTEEWCDLIDIFNGLFWLLCWVRTTGGQGLKQAGKLRSC